MNISEWLTLTSQENLSKFPHVPLLPGAAAAAAAPRVLARAQPRPLLRAEGQGSEEPPLHRPSPVHHTPRPGTCARARAGGASLFLYFTDVAFGLPLPLNVCKINGSYCKFDITF